MPKPVMIGPDDLCQLLEAHNLKNMKGYAKVAGWLYVKPQTVRAMCVRGCLKAYVDLIRFRIKESRKKCANC
jgi:hypothetical protein